MSYLKQTLGLENINIVVAGEGTSKRFLHLLLIQLQLLPDAVLHWEIPRALGSPRSRDYFPIDLKPREQVLTVTGLKFKLSNQMVELMCFNGHRT